MLTMRDIEDIAIIRNLREARDAREAAKEDELLSEELRRASLIIQQKDQQLQKLRADLERANTACNARNEVIRADNLVQKHLVEEISKAVGQPEEEVKKYAGKLRRRAFDRYVEDALANGTLKEDPRKNEMADWYSALP